MKASKDAMCIGCGCTDSHACLDGLDQPCSWIVVDRKAGLGVCSECPEAVTRWHGGDRTLKTKVRE